MVTEPAPGDTHYSKSHMGNQKTSMKPVAELAKPRLQSDVCVLLKVYYHQPGRMSVKPPSASREKMVSASGR